MLLQVRDTNWAGALCIGFCISKCPSPLLSFVAKTAFSFCIGFCILKCSPGVRPQPGWWHFVMFFAYQNVPPVFFFCRKFRKRRNPTNVFQVGWRKLWWGLTFWVPLWKEVSTSVIGSHFLNSLADKFPEKRASVFENGVSKSVVGFYFLNSPAASQRPY